jgi:hypothetical protein
VGEDTGGEEEIGGLDWANGLTLAYRLKYIHTASANKTIATIQRDEPLISVFLAIKAYSKPDIVYLRNTVSGGNPIAQPMCCRWDWELT